MTVEAQQTTTNNEDQRMADAINLPVGGNGGDFPVCPMGMQQAVCVDGIDLGEKVESYQGGPMKLTRKYALVFQTAERDEDTGAPYEVSAEFTASLGEKAALRKFINGWRGRDLTDDEAKTFDITELVGANALLNIVHKTSAKGRTYAKIASAAPLMKGMPKISEDGYERAKFWGMRKDDYLADVVKFKQAAGDTPFTRQAREQAQAAKAPLGAVKDEDLVGALTKAVEDDSSLPF